jgi:hypothetical protein
MSGILADVKQQAKSKKDRLFAIRPLQGALADVKSGETASMVARTFTYDEEMTKGFAVHLGPIFSDIDRACTQIIKAVKEVDPDKVFQLQSPGKTPPAQTFSVTVTTAASIWKLMDDNERWKREQEEAFKKILGERIAGCCSKIKTVAEDVKTAVYHYTTLMSILHAEPEQKYLDEVNFSLSNFAIEVKQQLTGCQNWTGISFGTWLTNHIREQKNAEKAIIKVRAGKTGFVILDSGLIAGHAAHAAASFGATAPLAIIAIVRQALDIAQIVGKSAASIDTLAKAITKEIKLVVDFYSADKPEAIATEVILNGIKGVLGVDVPSVATCNDHITEYEHKIRTLSSSYNQLQRELADWKRLLGNYQTLMKSQEAAKDMSATQRQEWIAMIASATKSYLALMACADDKDRRIDEAKQNVVDWKTTLSTVEEKTGKWAKYVAKAVGLATSAGLGLGHIGGEAIDGAAAAVEHTHKLLIEMGVVLTEDFTAPLLDKLQEMQE